MSEKKASETHLPTRKLRIKISMESQLVVFHLGEFKCEQRSLLFANLERSTHRLFNTGEQNQNSTLYKPSTNENLSNVGPPWWKTERFLELI